MNPQWYIISVATFYGIMLLFLSIYFLITVPSYIKKQFAYCLKCEIALFDKDWKRSKYMICKKCNLPMELIEIPKKLYNERIQDRKMSISMIPLAALSFYFSFFNLFYVFIAVFIPLFTIIIMVAYKWDMKSRRKIIQWIKSTIQETDI